MTKPPHVVLYTKEPRRYWTITKVIEWTFFVVVPIVAAIALLVKSL